MQTLYLAPCFIWFRVFHCSTLSSYTNFSLVNLFFMRPVNLFARTLQLVGYTKLLGQYSSTNYQLPLLQIKSSTLVCIIIVELLMIKYCLNVWWSACFCTVNVVLSDTPSILKYKAFQHFLRVKVFLNLTKFLERIIKIYATKLIYY